MQTTNFGIVGYSRDGTLLWSASLDPDEEPLPTYFWEGLPLPDPQDPADDIGDPRVLYDHFTGRFIVTALRFKARTFYFAMSHDDTPASGTRADWDTFVRPGLDPDPGGTAIIDWPGLAVNQHAIYLCTILPGGHVLQRLERPAIGDLAFYDSEPARHRRLVLSQLPPLFNHTNQLRLPMPALQLDASNEDVIHLVQLATRGVLNSQTDPGVVRVISVTNATTETTWTVGVEGSGDIDPNSQYQLCPETLRVQNFKENIQNAVVSDGRLVFTRASVYSGMLPESTIELPGRSVARWYVADLHGWPANPTPGPELIDRGVVDGGHVFGYGEKEDYGVQIIFPLIMPAPDGGLALFFTRYHRFGYFDLCWAGRRAGDPPGVMGAPITVSRGGEAGITDVTKPGDYEGIAPDPLDPARYWGTGETGRCFFELDNPCPACTVGYTQGYKHTSIGSYTIPADPIRTLTVARLLGDQPDSIYVKVSLCDVYQHADGELSTDFPEFVRSYGHGSQVTLLAPVVEGWVFSGWIINTEGGAPLAPTNRMTTIPLSANRTATPWYVRE